MSCEVKRFKKTKYCKADFRHIIDIYNVKVSSDYDNNASGYKQLLVGGINAIAVDRQPYIRYLQGETLDSSETHKFIIDYFLEFEDILQNPQSYEIVYNNKNFLVNRAVNENLDNMYIVIYANLYQNI